MATHKRGKGGFVPLGDEAVQQAIVRWRRRLPRVGDPAQMPKETEMAAAFRMRPAHGIVLALSLQVASTLLLAESPSPCRA